MKHKWLYIASGIGTIGVVSVVIAVVKKRARKRREEEEAAKTQQYEPPKEKSSLSKLQVGKKIYTKNTVTQLRSSARVNNGLINNISATVNGANTFIGTVRGIEIPDENYINPATTKPYVWALFNYAAKPSKELYVREDVVVIK
jgi:hypothetical protein